MSDYTKDFDIVPVVITFLNGDVIRLYISADFENYIVRQRDLREGHDLYVCHYSADPVLDFILRVNRKYIPHDLIRDVEFPQPEHEEPGDDDTPAHINEVGLAVWILEEEGDSSRIMVNEDEIGNF